MTTVYLSLGSNRGDRERTLRRAVDILAAPDFRVIRLSGVYETDPVDYLDQPRFLNLAIEAESDIFVFELLGRVQSIERTLGRRRVVPKGPRTIDIDLLLFGGLVLECPGLTIPHPRMHQRRFVLEPMAELAPDLRHPLLGKTMTELTGGVKAQTARRIGELK